MKTWLVTDTHWGHLNINKYCGRPENWPELFLERSRAVFKEDDLVFHLGDVYMGKGGRELAQEWCSLPGRKYLLLGNHDKDSKTKYLEMFDGVFDSLSVRGVYLSHHGVAQLPSDCQYQVFGHHHNSPLPPAVQAWKNAYRLSIELEDYRPVNLDRIISHIQGASK